MLLQDHSCSRQALPSQTWNRLPTKSYRRLSAVPSGNVRGLEGRLCCLNNLNRVIFTSQINIYLPFMPPKNHMYFARPCGIGKAETVGAKVRSGTNTPRQTGHSGRHYGTDTTLRDMQTPMSIFICSCTPDMMAVLPLKQPMKSG